MQLNFSYLLRPCTRWHWLSETSQSIFLSNSSLYTFMKHPRPFSLGAWILSIRTLASDMHSHLPPFVFSGRISKSQGTVRGNCWDPREPSLQPQTTWNHCSRIFFNTITLVPLCQQERQNKLFVYISFDLLIKVNLHSMLFLRNKPQRNIDWPTQEGHAIVGKFCAQGHGFWSQTDMLLKTDSTKNWW